MKTYEQRKAELPLRKDGAYLYIGNWRYYERFKFAENLSTGEITRNIGLDEFLIEKNIIDMMNPS